MNNLKSIPKLSNRYCVMRHAQSKANVQQIIVSHPENGLHIKYGLTDEGKLQSKISAESSNLNSETIIYCSDFARSRETASIVRQVLGGAELHVTQKLRERYFGNWEKSDHSNYQKIWEQDSISADNSNNNVESVNSVLDRATALVRELEDKYQNKTILLVSHGDTLQILQTGFQMTNPSQHRKLPHLETAEIRELKLITNLVRA